MSHSTKAACLYLSQESTCGPNKGAVNVACLLKHAADHALSPAPETQRTACNPHHMPHPRNHGHTRQGTWPEKHLHFRWSYTGEEDGQLAAATDAPGRARISVPCASEHRFNQVDGCEGS
ncbi:hypothetical protein AAFF_G00281940 [Aldrovandia affinis]|uniref:Uncharacterized protein n=1 Tax=Aldrovandia affinis TaxID=143900 RepID=A0AAD7RA10_9TELE|nr:hypothetical protein AAFF_G00281940 [Aldrovandia affinis]